MAHSDVDFSDLPDYLKLDFGRFDLDPFTDPPKADAPESDRARTAIEPNESDVDAESGIKHRSIDSSEDPGLDVLGLTAPSGAGSSRRPSATSQEVSQSAPPPYIDDDEDVLRAIALSKETVKADEQRRRELFYAAKGPTIQRRPIASSSRQLTGNRNDEGRARAPEADGRSVDDWDGWQAVALKKFHAQDEYDALELSAGERITDITTIDDEWLLGKNNSGRRGPFPKRLVSLIRPGLPATSVTSSSGMMRGRSSTNSADAGPLTSHQSVPEHVPANVQSRRALRLDGASSVTRSPAIPPLSVRTPKNPVTPIIMVQQPRPNNMSAVRDSLYSLTSSEGLMERGRGSSFRSMLSQGFTEQSDATLSTGPSVADPLDSPRWLEEPSTSPPRLQVPDRARDRYSSRLPARPKIRDTSRSRAIAGDQVPGDDKDTHACRSCKRRGPDRWYCDGCKAIFCDSCWNRMPLHDTQEDDQTDDGHQRTDVHRAKQVKAILVPKLTSTDREQLHVADIDTSWFGIVREEDNPLPLFRNYGRYTDLISVLKEIRQNLPPSSGSSLDESEVLYPGLASFVGQTGAGKSTLIKLLIDLGTKAGDPFFPTPVAGQAGVTRPTSEDVHLYLDPASSMSSMSRAPLLFADCEGLRGGEVDPTGAILRKLREQPALDSAVKPIKYTSERELKWATDRETKARSFCVAHLYPRLLYTFSEVIVFVEQNQRTLEDVFRRLVEWADAALEKSSNQPVLPHAIIALNQASHEIDPTLWNVDQATRKYMHSVSLNLGEHPVFSKHVKSWAERGRQISTIEQLLRSYYSDIRIVHIPAEGRTNLILQQVQTLYDEIHRASQRVREEKADLRMLLDADDFQPYLEQAFDHFAHDLDIPFDFVQASLASSPIPHDFGGNILKLAIRIMACWEDKAKGATIFEELSNMVASCIMLDATRSRIKGSPGEIFSSRYLEHIDNALENFCNLHWPCEFRDPRRGRCVNVRSGHGSKGHQLKDGRIYSADSHYQSTFSFHSYRDTFQKYVYSKLIALNRMVRERTKEAGGFEDEKAAAEVHRDRVLPTFIERASHNNPAAFVSHTVCFVCLFEPPEHALPCGHIICTSCLMVYGIPVKDRYITIHRCPMEKAERHFREAWKVRLKPTSCGVRVLTLDGGGFRGIVMLEIMKHIEKDLGNGLAIQSFFDLIVGTSTGGIIALGLTARNWPLSECTQKFESFCKQAFTLRKGANMPVVGRFVENHYHSKYQTAPLEQALISAFRDDQYLFGGEREANGSLDIKVAVTATNAAGVSVLLSNYNRLCFEKLTYQFIRPEELKAEVKTHEAARATSAAPFYFRPLHHEPSKQIFSDGGIYHNNPIKIAEPEWRLLWPDQQDADPDIVLSLGTGYCSKEKDVEKTSVRWHPEGNGIMKHVAFLFNMGKDHIHSSLRSENTWTEFISSKPKSSRERFVRLNPDLERPLPKLDEVDKMDYLKQCARTFCFANHYLIQTATQRMVASCFYLEVDDRHMRDSQSTQAEISGYVYCRRTESHEIKALGHYLKRHLVTGSFPCLVVREADNSLVHHTTVQLDQRLIGRMLNDGIFSLRDRLTIQRSNPQAVTEMCLLFTQGHGYPISGFPRQLTNKQPVNRSMVAAKESYRWKGRSASFRDRRGEWEPSPEWTSREYREAQDLIEHYADSPYLLGRATEDDLMPPGPGTHGAVVPVGLLSRASSFSLGSETRSTRQLRRTRTYAGFVDATSTDEIEPSTRSIAGASMEGHVQTSPSGPALRRSATLTSVTEMTEIQEARYLIARGDHQARSPHELSIRHYDIIRVTKTKPGWWLGHRSPHEREGWIPANILIPANDNAPKVFLQRAAMPSTDMLTTMLNNNDSFGQNQVGASIDAETGHLKSDSAYPVTTRELKTTFQQQACMAIGADLSPDANSGGGLRRVAQDLRRKIFRAPERHRSLYQASTVSVRGSRVDIERWNEGISPTGTEQQGKTDSHELSAESNVKPVVELPAEGPLSELSDNPTNNPSDPVMHRYELE